jgi:TRAP-type C4-dicarboxylate transport system permease large subunit
MDITRAPLAREIWLVLLALTLVLSLVTCVPAVALSLPDMMQGS